MSNETGKQSLLVRPGPRMPERRIIMMGNGENAQPSAVGRFCELLVDRCLDDRVYGHQEFALGFAAAIDAVSRGTVDFDEHPLNVVMAAWADINNVSSTPNRVTNIMRELGNRDEGDER